MHGSSSREQGGPAHHQGRQALGSLPVADRGSRQGSQKRKAAQHADAQARLMVHLEPEVRIMSNPMAATVMRTACMVALVTTFPCLGATPTDFVKPLIGTDEHGHVYPG